MKVTEAQWRRLSPEEQALLTKIGVKPAAKRKPWRKLQAPYILSHHQECLLCKDEVTTLYRMVPTYQDNIPYLQSRKLGKHQHLLPKKEDSQMVVTCSKCKKNLKEWSKEELILKVMVLARHTNVK